MATLRELYTRGTMNLWDEIGVAVGDVEGAAVGTTEGTAVGLKLRSSWLAPEHTYVVPLNADVKLMGVSSTSKVIPKLPILKVISVRRVKRDFLICTIPIGSCVL